jgi:alpha-galactosidase
MPKTPFVFQHNNLALRVDCDDRNRPRLTYIGLKDEMPEAAPDGLDRYLPFQVQGEQETARYWLPMGPKRQQSLPGLDFGLEDIEEVASEAGPCIVLTTVFQGLRVCASFQFYDNCDVIRTWLDIENIGDSPHGIEYVSSFFMYQLAAEGWHHHTHLHLCRNRWCGELRWHSDDIRAFGLEPTREHTTNRLLVSNAGNWSTKEYLPLGACENIVKNQTTIWQIENNGSWSYEIADYQSALYLLLTGPNEQDHHWFRKLQPDQAISTVPAAVGFVNGGLSDALAELNTYRRNIRRPNADDEKLPVIFNDYMNCLFADPTTEREMPYIKAAAEAGAEIYVIDAGWYAPRSEAWWGTVGEWQPSEDRFEGGIKTMLQTIRDHGMVPGLWLELEVMGTECALADQWPDECFFMRRGKRVACRGRYQLDYRHPTVRAHADEVVDRLVKDYGVGYIKMDYNIDPGIGTEVDADSAGDGLLQHGRAYLDWLEKVFERYPDLVIENCSSGGLRMDYALLARHSLQSISDQEDVGLMARIAAAGASGATPEQQAMWVYPVKEDSREKVILNCVNGLLMRLHISGQLAELTDDNRSLIAEAVNFYKQYREVIPTARPFWPFGLPQWDATASAAGLKTDDQIIIAAWNFDESPITLAIPLDSESAIRVAACYPSEDACQRWTLEGNQLIVQLPEGPSGRVVRLIRQ